MLCEKYLNVFCFVLGGEGECGQETSSNPAFLVVKGGTKIPGFCPHSLRFMLASMLTLDGALDTALLHGIFLLNNCLTGNLFPFQHFVNLEEKKLEELTGPLPSQTIQEF